MGPDLTVPLTFIFYNLQVGRNAFQVRLELRALAAIFRPAVLCGVEAVGYTLKPIRGYDLVRDRSTESRANNFAYVRKGRLSKVVWHDLEEVWRKTDHPGMHAPRSFVEFHASHIRVVVGHQAQHPSTTRFHDTGPAQREGADCFVSLLAPETRTDWDSRGVLSQRRELARPTIALADWNDGRPTGPSAADIAVRSSAHVYGYDIDRAVARNMDVKRVRYIGVFRYLAKLLVLRSDHKHALVVDVVVPRRWWR